MACSAIQPPTVLISMLSSSSERTVGVGPLNTETVSFRFSLVPSMSVTQDRAGARPACGFDGRYGNSTAGCASVCGSPNRGTSTRTAAGDVLPEVAGKKESVWPTTIQVGKELKMGCTDIPRLVHYRKVEQDPLVLRSRPRLATRIAVHKRGLIIPCRSRPEKAIK